jgi:hypothetical protein
MIQGALLLIIYFSIMVISIKTKHYFPLLGGLVIFLEKCTTTHSLYISLPKQSLHPVDKQDYWLDM